MSHVIKETTDNLGITLKHATTKHVQTIGMIDRPHASSKQTLKVETRENRSLWHKSVSVAVLNSNRSYQSSIGCKPSRVFHGPIPYNILDLTMGICPHYKKQTTNSQNARDVLEQTKMIYQVVQKQVNFRQKNNSFRAERKRLCAGHTA